VAVSSGGLGKPPAKGLARKGTSCERTGERGLDRFSNRSE